MNLWHIGPSIYGTHINLRHPSVYRRQSRGIRPDIPLRTHPARHPVLGDRSDRFKSLAVFLSGAAIGLLFAMNVLILLKPIPWVDPPAATQAFLFICRPSGASARSCQPCSSSARRLQGLSGGRSSGNGATRHPVRKAPPRTRSAAASFRPAQGRLPQLPSSFPATAPPGPEGPTRCGGSRCLSACR
ncbi:MAG: hypothetical protein MZV70_51325 [Desulfobacterales bacterium]|nr:hypothetical protein [Desulfobacterales bacterium]